MPTGFAPVAAKTKTANTMHMRAEELLEEGSMPTESVAPKTDLQSFADQFCKSNSPTLTEP
jgi:hypothetical protein